MNEMSYFNKNKNPKPQALKNHLSKIKFHINIKFNVVNSPLELISQP